MQALALVTSRPMHAMARKQLRGRKVAGEVNEAK